jgi:DNA polymerase III sliding clamp (beta) subunit (PCNA family)
MLREALVDALNKTSLTSIKPNTTWITLKAGEPTIALESMDEDLGRKNRVSKSAEYTGDTPRFAIDADKLLTLLGQIDTEQVSLHIYDPTKAILLSTDEDTDYLGLIMPILINS